MDPFEDIASFDALLDAHRKARKGKGNEKSCITYELNLCERLAKLSRKLNDGEYAIAGYHSFHVYDPKKRIIHALGYEDRVVQHSLCDHVLKPILDPRLIFDNAACREGKGTDFARDRLKYFLRRLSHQCAGPLYFLQLDIHHYFESIDHEKLLKKLAKIFSGRTYALLKRIIDSYSSSPGRGLPLGNQSSQWFGIYYLDELDRLAKEKLRLKYYIRYMDDIVVLSKDKRELDYALSNFRRSLSKLGLTCNSKTSINPISKSLSFLGFRFWFGNNGAVKTKPTSISRSRFFRANKEIMSFEQCQSYYAYFSKTTDRKMAILAHRAMAS